MAFTVSGRDGRAIWQPDRRKGQKTQSVLHGLLCRQVGETWEKVLLLFYFFLATQEMVVGIVYNDGVCVSGDCDSSPYHLISTQGTLICHKGLWMGDAWGELIGKSSGRWHTFQITEHPRTMGWWICFIFYPFSTVACKVLFIFFPQGSLRSSHQISPQEFLGELKSGVMDERLFACLDSLRVSLTSNPVRYNTDNGNSLKQSSVTQHVYLLCDIYNHYPMSDFSPKHYVWTSYPTEHTGEVLNMTYNLRKYFCYKTGKAPSWICLSVLLDGSVTGGSAFPKNEIQMPDCI